MNGYICFYRGMRFECHADTSYKALCKAHIHFSVKRKGVKRHEIVVVLAEINGETVVHSGAEL